MLDWADVVPNPARSPKVRLPRQAEQEIDPPSHAELRALERAIAPACRQAVATLHGAGLRVSELLSLSVGDLHPPRGRMRIARRAHQERHGGPALGAAPRLPGGDAERPARRGRGASGLPRPLGLALFVREFDQEVRAPFPPPVVVRATLAPLAWLARRRGRGARYAGRPATA